MESDETRPWAGSDTKAEYNVVSGDCNACKVHVGIHPCVQVDIPPKLTALVEATQSGIPHICCYFCPAERCRDAQPSQDQSRKVCNDRLTTTLLKEFAGSRGGQLVRCCVVSQP